MNRLPLAILLALSFLFVPACGEEEEQPIPEFEFNLEVQAQDQDDDPLPGVPVLLDGEVIGLTDAEGEFHATLLEQPTVEIELAVGDLDGYHLPSDGSSTREELRLTQAIGGGYRGVPVSLRVNFQSVVSHQLVWVQIECDDGLDDDDCEGIPLLFDDEQVAVTDAHGYAYFALQGVPGDEHTLRLDTPPDDDDNPNFQPAQPTYVFEIPRDTNVFSIQETFEDPDASRPAPRRRRARPTPQPAPEPDPPAEEEEDDSSSGGPIPLF